MLWNQGGGGGGVTGLTCSAGDFLSAVTSGGVFTCSTPGGSGDITAVGDCASGACFDGTTGNSLQFEGATANGFETTLTATDPTADRTATLPNFSGTVAMERVYDVRAYGAVCDGATNDATAIQAAIDAANTRGGIVQFPEGTCAVTTALNLDEYEGIILQGQGGRQTTTSGTILDFNITGSGSLLSAKSASGITLRDMAVRSKHASFTGKLIDVSQSASLSDATFITLDNTYIIDLGGGVRSSTLLYLDKAHTIQVQNSRFENGGTAIYGKASSGSYSNVVNITGTYFANQDVAPIFNPGDSWVMQGNTFQQRADGTSVAINHDSGVNGRGQLIAGNIFNDSTTGTSSWITTASSGVQITGNLIAGTAGTEVGITIDATTFSGSIDANTFVVLGTGIDCTTGTAAQRIGQNTFTTVTTSLNSDCDGGTTGAVQTTAAWVLNSTGNAFVNLDSDNSGTGTGFVVAHNGVGASGGTKLLEVNDNGDVSFYRGMDPRLYETDNTNYVQISAPTLAGNWTLTLPTTDGNADELLKTDGSGATSWVAASSLTAGSASDLTDAGVDAVLPHLDGFGLSINSATTPDELQFAPGEVTGPQVWGDGSGTMSWTFNAGITDPIIDFYATGVVDVTGTLQMNTVPVVTETGTQTLTNKTLTTPTIASFTNATHSHQNAAGGGTLDHGAALTGLSDDDHTQYTLRAGRASTGNDTIISTDGAGTIYGSGTTANDLTLRANDDDTTTGEINLNAPRVDLWPSFPASPSATYTLIDFDSTGTYAAAAQFTGIEIQPTFTLQADAPVIHGYQFGGTLDTTSTSNPLSALSYRISGFYSDTIFTSSTASGTHYPDMFLDLSTIEYTGASNVTSARNPWAPISFFAGQLDKTTSTGDYGIDQQIGFHHKPRFSTANAGSEISVVDLDSLMSFPPSHSTDTGTVAITNYALAHADWSSALGNRVTITNAYGLRLEDFDDATNNYSVYSDANTTLYNGGVMDLGDAIADMTTNTTSVLDISPDVALTGIGGRLNAINFSPTIAASSVNIMSGFAMVPTMTSSSLSTVNAFSVAGTYTQTASGSTYTQFNISPTYTSATAGVQPYSTATGITFAPTISSTAATTGTASPGAMVGYNHQPTISMNDADGATGGLHAMTVTSDTGFQAGGTYTETAGTMTVTTRTGFKANDITNTSSATTLTTNIGVDVARQTAGTTDIGIRGFGISMQKVDNSSTCTACTDAHISWNDSSFIRLTGNSAKVVSGIGGGVDGAILYLYNQGSGSLTIDDDDSAAAEDTPASQILTMSGADKVCSGVCVVTMIYDSGASRWVVTAVSD